MSYKDLGRLGRLGRFGRLGRLGRFGRLGLGFWLTWGTGFCHHQAQSRISPQRNSKIRKVRWEGSGPAVCALRSTRPQRLW